MYRSKEQLQNVKQVVLPDGRTFIARYERVSKDCLMPNITIRRRFRQRAAPRNRCKCQKGRGFFNFLKKAAKNPMVKALGRAALVKVPASLDHASKNVKNKTVRNILGSDAIKTFVQQSTNSLKRRLRGIDNRNVNRCTYRTRRRKRNTFNNLDKLLVNIQIL